MDDIFEKLDHFRLEQLFRLLPGFRLMQLFLTHTEEEELEKLLPVYNKDFQIIKL
jgi:DNA replication and repair protein RecF